MNAKFQQACKEGKLDLVRELLALSGDREVDVHAMDERALFNACSSGHVDVVRELLALSGHREVDVHARNDSAFISACSNGHLNVVRELLAMSGNQKVNVHARSERAFLIACFRNAVDVVRELLALSGDRQVDVHAGGGMAFRTACGRGYVGVVHELLALSGDRQVDFCVGFRGACSGGHVNVVRELLALSGVRNIASSSNLRRLRSLMASDAELLCVAARHDLPAADIAPIVMGWLSSSLGLGVSCDEMMSGHVPTLLADTAAGVSSKCSMSHLPRRLLSALCTAVVTRSILSGTFRSSLSALLGIGRSFIHSRHGAVAGGCKRPREDGANDPAALNTQRAVPPAALVAAAWLVACASGGSAAGLALRRTLVTAADAEGGTRDGLLPAVVVSLRDASWHGWCVVESSESSLHGAGGCDGVVHGRGGRGVMVLLRARLRRAGAGVR
jgi:hypothetical protein